MAKPYPKNLPFHNLLTLGGARSGKSAFARRCAENSGLEPVFIATAAAGDDEMAARIARHRLERGSRWRTVEEQRDLCGALAANADEERIMLVDCLTLWLSNLAFAGADLDVETRRLAAAVGGLKGPAIFVSNEIGLGLVPETALGRAFRDAQGRLNQAMARACDRVVFIAAGLPLTLKPNADASL